MLAAQLAREAGIEVVGSAGARGEALEIIGARRPDVLLVSLALRNLEGPRLVNQARAQHPEVKIVVLSGHSDGDRVRRNVEAGVQGYVTTSCGLRGLLQAVHGAMRNRMAASEARQTAPLGHRERQVLALLAEGVRSAAVAAQLGISVATVRAHRRNAVRKLGLHSAAALTRYAVRAGLATLDDDLRPAPKKLP